MTTQNKRGGYPYEDADFYPKYQEVCQICGISSFAHRHKAGSLPKDFERLPEASKTKERASGEDIPRWSERLQKAYDQGYADARREEIERMIERLRKPIQWIVGDDTGASSKVIWSVMMGVEPTWESVPYDEADYGRCVRLLRFIPEWQSRLNEVVDRYPNWKEAIKHILATLREEGV